MKTRNKAALSLLSFLAVVLLFSSCSWHPRWHSYYGKKPKRTHERYDPYKLKWYRKSWKNGTI